MLCCLRLALLAMRSTCNEVARALFVMKMAPRLAQSLICFRLKFRVLYQRRSRVFINLILLNVDEVVLSLDTV